MRPLTPLNRVRRGTRTRLAWLCSVAVLVWTALPLQAAPQPAADETSVSQQLEQSMAGKEVQTSASQPYGCGVKYASK